MDVAQLSSHFEYINPVDETQKQGGQKMNESLVFSPHACSLRIFPGGIRSHEVAGAVVESLTARGLRHTCAWLAAATCEQ